MCDKNGHYFVWTGDPNYPLPEGFPCECGMMLYHTEKCKECGTIINKPIRRNELFAKKWIPVALETWPQYKEVNGTGGNSCELSKTAAAYFRYHLG